MSFLHSPPSTPPSDFPAEPAISYTFPLDAWQQHGVVAIHKGQNILVTAKTGSGKTLLAEYQIAFCIAKGERVFYTTPIKSLSNQKYMDLKHLFPAASVGLLTGDMKVNPDAQIVVMTTEIFRNLLFKESTSTSTVGTAGHLTLTGLGAVVFDEVHYINDVDRGHVWEESLILLPPTTRAVLLSATMRDAEAFGAWFGEIHKHPVVLLQTTHRVVPLVHAICVPEDPRFFVPYKTGSREGEALPTPGPAREAPFDAAVYMDYLKARKADYEGAKAWAHKVAAAQAAGDSAGGLSGKVKLHAFPHLLNKTVEQLKARGLAPALFFTFSRKKCEEYADLVSHSLVTGSEIGEIKRQIAFHLAPHRAVLEPLAQYHQVLKLLERGVAFHHSGLLPLLKEIVELLFGRGFLKVLFCTETFAVGLNMPARTVVFLDLVKPTEHGPRPLTTEEYIQMAGRAGRRGKDTEGLVLYLPSREPVGLGDLRGILGGGLAVLRSRMAFHYDFILKALHKRPDLAATLLDNSYGTVQRRARKALVDAQIAVLTERVAALGVGDEHRALVAEGEGLQREVATTRRGPHKKATEALAAWSATNGAAFAAAKALLDREKALWREREDFVVESEGYAAENDSRRFEPVLQALEDGGYVSSGSGWSLTPLGILATECNEANPLLFSYLYESGLLKGARVEEIVGVVAAFIGDKEACEKSKAPKDLVVSRLVQDVLYTIGDWAEESADRDYGFGVRSPNEYWQITTLWVEIASRWLADVPAAQLCFDYELMEGNLMKGLLKIANLVREWKAMATVRADVEMLATLDGVESRLLKGVAVPESLYLRL